MIPSSDAHPLAIYRNSAAYRWNADAELDRQLTDALAHKLIWSIRPALTAMLLRQRSLGPPSATSRLRNPHEFGSSLPRAIVSFLLERIQISRPVSLRASLDAGVLRLWTTANQQLALFGRTPSQGAFTIRVFPRHTRSLNKDAREALRQVASRAVVPEEGLRRFIGQVVSIQESIRKTIEQASPRIVITASTELAFSRLAVSACRELEVPTMYVPHAPTANNRIYADIPHDYAALRGVADWTYYASLGAKTGRATVVGDQSFDVSPIRSHSNPPVLLFATGFGSSDTLEDSIKAVQRSIGPFVRIVLAPHPRGRNRALRIARKLAVEVVPNSLRTAQALTLLNVALAVTEHSSGVALEILAHGVPVRSLSSQPNYLYEEELGVNPIERAELVETLVQSIEDADTFRGRRVDVTQYIAATGDKATRAICEAIAKPLAPQPDGMLDSWRWTSRSG